MRNIIIKTVCLIAAVTVFALAGGCDEAGRAGGKSKLLQGETELGPTIGSLVTVYSPESVTVEGYGIVGGLQGAGSSECPPALRAYFKRYIRKQLSEQRINVDKLIDDPSTAVVHITGKVPPLASRDRRFDVLVTALVGTQTTSLDGGWLYAAELRVTGNLGKGSPAVGKVAGPIFTDRIGDLAMSKRTGYVLGGAEVFDDDKISVILHKAVFEVAGTIRNRINERFGFGIAKAMTPGRIELRVPPKYAGQMQRFVSLIEAMYLTHNPDLAAQRILTHIRILATADEKYPSEIALEAIGNESLPKLSILLNSSDQTVRLHAARCMLNLGSDDGLSTLIQIAMTKSSSLRIEALKSLTNSANRNDAAAISRRLLRDSSFDIRLAAYEQLLQLEDASITRLHIARSFYLDRLASSQYKGVFVSRSGQPRIALLAARGDPIRCRDNLFVQSQDGSIVLNAPRGQRYVSIIRKQPRLGTVLGNLRSSYDLADIVQKLCSEPPEENNQGAGGLGVSYSEMIALVKQLSDKGAINAEFRAGPMPKIGVNVKK